MAESGFAGGEDPWAKWHEKVDTHPAPRIRGDGEAAGRPGGIESLPVAQPVPGALSWRNSKEFERELWHSAQLSRTAAQIAVTPNPALPVGGTYGDGVRWNMLGGVPAPVGITADDLRSMRQQARPCRQQSGMLGEPDPMLLVGGCLGLPGGLATWSWGAGLRRRPSRGTVGPKHARSWRRPSSSGRWSGE